MKQIIVKAGTYRTVISEYINQAAYGNHEIIITRRGKPICKLIALSIVDPAIKTILVDSVKFRANNAHYINQVAYSSNVVLIITRRGQPICQLVGISDPKCINNFSETTNSTLQP